MRLQFQYYLPPWCAHTWNMETQSGRFRRYKVEVEVERFQRWATKLIHNMKQLPYEDRLKVLGLPSLEYMRRRGDMLQVFKILNDIDRVETSMNTESSTRGHDQKHARLGIRQAVFSQPVNDWNMLPVEVIHSPSVNAFNRNWTSFG